jgi:hypothetical protein
MSRIIELKMEELEEAEIGSSKDIAELLQMAHKMRMEEIKAMQNENKEAGKVVVNNTTNAPAGTFGENYDSLLGKLMKGG